MVMIDQYILGGFVASLFGFVLLYNLRRKITKNNGSKILRKDQCIKTSDGGILRPVVDAGRTDVIIVGAGVAGAALAYALGKEGRRVHAIERDLTEPDRIVGELLQPGGYLKLIELGLEDCLQDIDAQRVFGYALYMDGKHTKLSYPLEKFNSDVSGRSFHNGRFVQRMREKAATLPNAEVRCLVDVPGQKVPSIANGEMATYLKTVVAPQIPSQLYDAFIAAIDKGNIKTMPNRNIVVIRNLLRPLHDLNDAATLSKYLESFYTLRKPVASTINTLAGALYKVFCASPDQARKEMREACFDYLSLGGIFSNGPVSLLSGLNPRPLSLVLHFFAVAVFGVGRLFLPFPTPKRIWLGARLLSGASGIIFPIMNAEGFRQMFFPATVPAYYRSPPVK
ncbi:unnamed protein product [Fraxinus pennsylvanica]|uniref:Squalene monooxygenase n=1 Tax=Fraxinus pennsylvanica TaxID=56036 RepID=A0AAD1Z806_9LAMI|nr:unnamed protein product [Fraxinus pennsylvanica]